MEKRIRCFGAIAGLLAFLLCFTGGMWIVINADFDPSDPLGMGIGLYFVGKALFVGPMLVIASLQYRDPTAVGQSS